MTDQPGRPIRRSPRLKGYDYAENAAYFVTQCTQNRLCLFGSIEDGVLQLNAAGHMIASWWEKLPDQFPGVELDAMVVMPNHIHGLIIIHSSEEHAGFDVKNRVGNAGADMAAPLPKPTLPRIMQWFKAMTTNAYIRGVKESGWETFPGKLWQRSYYDHIVRDQADLDRIRAYIINNPANWQTDTENPSSHPP